MTLLWALNQATDTNLKQHVMPKGDYHHATFERSHVLRTKRQCQGFFMDGNDAQSNKHPLIRTNNSWGNIRKRTKTLVRRITCVCPSRITCVCPSRIICVCPNQCSSITVEVTINVDQLWLCEALSMLMFVPNLSVIIIPSNDGGTNIFMRQTVITAPPPQIPR